MKDVTLITMSLVKTLFLASWFHLFMVSLAAGAEPVETSAAAGKAETSVVTIGPSDKQAAVNGDDDARIILKAKAGETEKETTPREQVGTVLFKGPPPTGGTHSVGPIEITSEGAKGTAGKSVKTGVPFVNNEKLTGGKLTTTQTVAATSSTTAGASASSRVNDPLVFGDAALAIIPIGFGLNAGTSLSAVGAALSLANFTGSTDLPGLESLYDLTIAATSVDATSEAIPRIEFSSNPALGLDDNSIEEAIMNIFLANPQLRGTFTIPFDIQLFSFSITVPADVNTVSLSFSDSVDVSAAPIPAPGTLLLVIIGAAGMGLTVRSRRARAELSHARRRRS